MLPDNFVLKEAQSEDFQKLAALYRACREDTDMQLVPDYFQSFPEGWAEDVWTYHFNNTDFFKARVLWDGGKPVGFCRVGALDQSYGDCLEGAALPFRCGELHQIYLLPEYQKQGLGRVLYQAALEDLRDMGFRNFIICTYAENENAKTFYARMGASSLTDSTLHVFDADQEWDRPVSFLVQPVPPKIGPAPVCAP